MQFKERVRTTVGFSFQLILIAISTAILGALIVWRSSIFVSHEQMTQIKPITPTKFREFGGFSHSMVVGLLIDQFINFEMVTNKFTFDGTVWFKFNPGAISLDSLEKFSFVKGTIKKKSEPHISLIDDKMLVKYAVRVEFISDLNYQDFPLDSHSLYIELINEAVSPSEILFESSRREFSVNDPVTNSGWQLVDTAVKTGYLTSRLDPYDPRQDSTYPVALFSLDYARNSIRYTLLIIFPLALIFYLMFFSLSLRLTSAIGITSSGITAILAYRFVIENLSPKTGFFMISDYLFFLFLAATICSFIVNVIEAKFQIKSRYKKIVISVLHIITILCIIYIIIW